MLADLVIVPVVLVVPPLVVLVVEEVEGLYDVTCCGRFQGIFSLLLETSYAS